MGNKTNLIRLPQDTDEILGLGRILRSEERVRRARLVGPSRASDSVHIVLAIGWVIVVDDKLHIVHVWYNPQCKTTIKQEISTRVHVAERTSFGFDIRVTKYSGQ